MPFPKDTKVLGWHVSDNDFMTGTLLLKVQHKKLRPVAEGDHIEIINPVFKTMKNGRVQFVDWGYYGTTPHKPATKREIKKAMKKLRMALHDRLTGTPGGRY